MLGKEGEILAGDGGRWMAIGAEPDRQCIQENVLGGAVMFTPSRHVRTDGEGREAFGDVVTPALLGATLVLRPHRNSVPVPVSFLVLAESTHL